jgi:hypothetical protein
MAAPFVFSPQISDQPSALSNTRHKFATSLVHYPGSNENSVLVMSMKFGSSDFETDGINKLIEG